MACTTILIGKNASNDNSTIIARNDDSPSGVFTCKKVAVRKNPEEYESKISHLKIKLPKESYSYTYTPNVDLKEGIWGACGINEKNVAMTATETITSNPRVLSIDPLVKYDPKTKKEGGIGEEDLVILVLPYIKTAKEGVILLGKLLEEYGTYESNGIAFSDKNEIWYVETIGGHHYIAKKIKDDEVAILPNQFNIDNFDFEDAFTNQKENMCSKDLKEFIADNNLDLTFSDDDAFNPRLAFGSHSDIDHCYNTPRSYFMLYYLNKELFNKLNLRPDSDNIPFSFTPSRKLTIEDVKYVLSSHFQGMEFDPYDKFASQKGRYRPIGISRTSFLGILQIRNNVDSKIAGIEWIGFASNVFNSLLPIYTNTTSIPEYLSNTTLKVDSNNFYWASRLIAALADAHFNTATIHIERYQEASMIKSRELINKYDKLFKNQNIEEFTKTANEEIAQAIKELTYEVLDKVLYNASLYMKNSYSRSDN